MSRIDDAAASWLRPWSLPLMVSVVIPAYQAGSTIAATVLAVHRLWASRRVAAEVLVVDDGSTDGTGDIVDSLHLPRVRVLRQPNRGKGAAVQAGVAGSSGTYLYFTDADLPYSLEDQVRIVETVRAGAPVVVGSRRMPTSDAAAYPALRRLASASLGLLVKATLDVTASDTQCGLKGFDGHLARQLFLHLRVPGFGFDLEIFALLAAWKVPVLECPVHLTHERTSTVQLARDSARMLYDLRQIRRYRQEGHYLPSRSRSTGSPWEPHRIFTEQTGFGADAATS